MRVLVLKGGFSINASRKKKEKKELAFSIKITIT